jgi:site-specific DNA-methyltransferase (adenine-specific)
MVTGASGAGQYDLPGFAPVPRIQIVTIAEAMALRDRAVRLLARGDGGFKRAANEKDIGRQQAMDL